LDRPRMLLDDDVVSDGQAKAGALSSGFCREERVEHLVPYLGRDAGAVIAYPDLYTITKVSGYGRQRGLVTAVHLRFAFSRRIEAVRNQVQQDSRDFLREAVNLTGGGV